LYRIKPTKSKYKELMAMSAKITLEFEIEQSDVNALAALAEIEDISAKKLLKGSKDELCKKYNENFSTVVS
jgi:hypothetical protein